MHAEAESSRGRRTLTCRGFLARAGTTGLVLAGGAVWRPARVAAQGSDAGRPQLPFGAQVGDVSAHQAMLWAATDRPARMVVEYATSESFENVRRVAGPAALPESGLAAKVGLTDLPSGEDIFCRVSFLDLGDLRTVSRPVEGRFRTAPADGRDVTFVWTGDTAGQGWGIDLDGGGMKAHETMRRLQPDFFVHSGDMIYADSPLKGEVPLPGGGVWRNVLTEEKSKVAETLDEFRGNYKYNWFHERRLDTDERYRVKSAALLADSFSRRSASRSLVGDNSAGRVRLAGVSWPGSAGRSLSRESTHGASSSLWRHRAA